MKIELDLPDDLIAEASAVAARRRTTADAVIENALRKEFYDAPQPRAVAAAEPREAVALEPPAQPDTAQPDAAQLDAIPAATVRSAATAGSVAGEPKPASTSKWSKPILAICSLAALLVIIAIAIPTIGSITSKAKESKNKRNAQNLASVYASAVAAGADFGITEGAPDAVSIYEAIEKLTSAVGVSGSAAAGFEGTYFRVPNMSEDERAGATLYLDWDDGMFYAP